MSLLERPNGQRAYSHWSHAAPRGPARQRAQSLAPKQVPAIAYLRTSSAANVGADKDSDKRQREAIAAFAKRAGFILVGEYYDAAVSGADPIETRPGFAELLNRIEDNGVRTVIVEDASRFARELVTQELGIMALIKRGMRVLTANGDDLTDSSDPSRKMMRQIAGSFHEYVEIVHVTADLQLSAIVDKRALIGQVHPDCADCSWISCSPPYQRGFLFSDQFGLAGIAASPRVFNQKIAAVVSGGTFDTYCPMASSQMALM
jgi:hypothetical protein